MTADRVPDERPDDERTAADQPVDHPIDQPIDRPIDRPISEAPTEVGSGEVAEAVERPRETSDAEIDAMFAELMAGYGRTAGSADRVHPTHADPVVPDRPRGESPSRWADPWPTDRTEIPPNDPRPSDSPPRAPQSISGPTRDRDDRADTHPSLARPDSPTPEPSRPDPTATHPPAADAQATESRWRASPRVDVTGDEAFERYRPELHPLGRPRWPIVVGWGGMLFAVVATLLAIFGVPVPGWVGWLSVAGFLGGFGLLVAQLPRHRPPDAGDGAVL